MYLVPGRMVLWIRQIHKSMWTEHDKTFTKHYQSTYEWSNAEDSLEKEAACHTTHDMPFLPPLTS